MTDVLHSSKLWWVISGELAGMPQPQVDDLSDLYQAGVRGIISLLEDETGLNEYRAKGFETQWTPVADDGVPTTEQVEELVAFVDEQIAKDHPVAIHCVGGRGRTGTLLAAYLISKGATYEEAMDRIDEAQPNAIRKEFQRKFLERLAAPSR